MSQQILPSPKNIICEEYLHTVNSCVYKLFTYVLEVWGFLNMIDNHSKCIATQMCLNHYRCIAWIQVQVTGMGVLITWTLD